MRAGLRCADTTLNLENGSQTFVTRQISSSCESAKTARSSSRALNASSAFDIVASANVSGVIQELRMNMSAVKKEIEGLERSWSAAHREAVAAEQELAGKSTTSGLVSFGGPLVAALAAGISGAMMVRPLQKSAQQKAEARLEGANRRKQEIMREIEALESSLLR
jgi:hypothetical protein